MGRTTRCSGFRFLVDFGLFVGSDPIQAHRESWILLAAESVSTSVLPPLVYQDSEPVTSSRWLALNQYRLICHNVFAVASDIAKISIAMTRALIVVNRDCKRACARERVRNKRPAATDTAGALDCRRLHIGILRVGDIRNRVESLLMRFSELAVFCLKKVKSFLGVRVTKYRTCGAPSSIRFDDKGCFCSLCCKGFNHVAVWRVGGAVVV